MAFRPLTDAELEELVNASTDESLSEFEDHVSIASESECSDDSNNNLQCAQNTVQRVHSKMGI